MANRIFAIHVIVYTVTHVYAELKSVDSEELSLLLKNEIEHRAITYPQMQALMNKAAVSNSPINGEEEIEKIKTNTEKLLNSVFEGVTLLQRAVYDSYQDPEHSANYTVQECCNVITGLQWNERFKQSVDFSKTCYQISTTTPVVKHAPTSQLLLDAMRENYSKIRYGYDDLPVVKWQYYGDENGYLVSYPAEHVDDCRDYDPRLRPWYSQTSTPGDKIVVIVLDTSSNMDPYRELAIDAIETLLGTLNPDDLVGLVSIQSYASKPPGCYQKELAKATPENIQAILKYAKSLQNSGTSNIIQGLKEVFQYIASGETALGTEKYTETAKVMAMFTLGQTDDAVETVLDKLSELNAQTGNSVRIMTYGIGTGANGAFLEQMANMAVHNSSAGQVKTGQYATINDTANIRRVVGNFYNVFYKQSPNNTDIVVSTPYTDYSNLGTVVSVCLPVIYEGVHKGVTCIDVPLIDINTATLNAEQHRQSYSFMVDNRGRASVHPLLPQRVPTDYNAPPAFVDIKSLENDPSVKEIISKIKSHESGKRNVHKGQYLQGRGEVHADGVNVLERSLTFHYRPLQFALSVAQKYSICFVHVDEEQRVTISSDRTSERFIYSNLYMGNSGLNLCDNYGAVAVTDTSAVKLTSDAFNPGYDRDYATETTNVINEYTSHMTGDATSNKLRVDVGGMVGLSEGIEAEWGQEAAPLTYVTQRFYADRTGFIRTYPGAKLGAEYRYEEQRWYQRTTSTPAALVFTPYTNTEFNNMKTIKATKAIILENKVVGVIGADLYYRKFESLLQQNFKECTQEHKYCFLFDNNGFIIYHPRLHTQPLTDNQLHLTNMEPYIARNLITKGDMMSTNCTDLGRKESLYTWRVKITRDIGHLDSEFYITPVPYTNIYLAVTSDRQLNNSCPCTGRTCLKYKQGDAAPTNCECPCAKLLSGQQYQYCTDDFEVLLSSSHPCTPGKPYYSFTQYYDNETATLPNCQTFTCDSRNTKWDCIETVNCDWCQSSENCYDMSQLPDSCQSDKTGAIVGGVIGGVLLASALVVGGYCLYKRLHNKQQTRHISDNVGSLYDGNMTDISKPNIPETIHEEDPDIVRGTREERNTNSTYASLDGAKEDNGKVKVSVNASDEGVLYHRSRSADSLGHNNFAFSMSTNTSSDNTLYKGNTTDNYSQEELTDNPVYESQETTTNARLFESISLSDSTPVPYVNTVQPLTSPKFVMPLMSQPMHNISGTEQSVQYYQCAEGHFHRVDEASQDGMQCVYIGVTTYSPVGIADTAVSYAHTSPRAMTGYSPRMSPVPVYSTVVRAPVISQETQISPSQDSYFMYPRVDPDVQSAVTETGFNPNDYISEPNPRDINVNSSLTDITEETEKTSTVLSSEKILDDTENIKIDNTAPDEPVI